MEEKEWFLYVADHHEGPFTIDEIKKLVKSGEAKSTSYVWKEGFEDWMMMTDITEFGYTGPKGDSHGAPSFIVSSAPQQAGVGPSESVWCLNSRKTFTGPHSLKTIIRKVNDGQASVKDSIWREGWSSFVTISEIPEIMKEVKATVLEGDKAVTPKAGDSAKALGMGGGPATRTYKWYKSRPFFMVSILLSIMFVYQLLASGHLKPVFEMIGLKEQVASLELAPLPFEKAIDVAMQAKDMALPTFEKALTLLPDDMRAWLSSIEIPEGLSPVDAETVREIAMMSLKDGVRVASLLPAGDEFNPSFVIVANVPDGTSFTAVLRGKEGTLLNAFSYERTAYVDMHKSVGRTPRFAYEGNKPLPKGEYVLVVYESDQQIPEAAAALSGLSKKQTPASVPQGKVAFVVDSYFLGGKRDPNYATRLREFNERIKARLEQESNELKQITMTLESMANESATKFFALASTPATPRRKAEWDQYRLKYAKISEQVKAMLDKSNPGDAKTNEYALPQLYRKAIQTYELTERLHQTETEHMEKGGSMDSVKALASQTAGTLNELKQAITRVAK